MTPRAWMDEMVWRGAADARADERRQAPPRAEIEVHVGEDHRCLVVEIIDVEAAAARAELGVAADRLALAGAAELAGDVGAEPGVPLITETEADESDVLDVLLVDAPPGRPHERGVGLGMVEVAEALASDADVAAQIPAAEFLDRRRHGRR